MRASRLGWRIAAAVAFGATAALAVTLSRGAPMHAALISARDAGSAKGHGASGVPRCAPSGLRVSMGAGTTTGGRTARGGARGRTPDRTVTSYPLDFTNVSGAACTLGGYPAVSAYRGDRVQVGNAAGADTAAAAHRILLVPGATAHAAVITSIPAADRCRPVVATGLRVSPPGQSAARYLRHTLLACSAAGPRAPVFLHVRAVQPGTGWPAGGPAPQPLARQRPAASPSPASPPAHASAVPTRTSPVP